MCYSLARRAAPVSLAAPAPPLTQCRRRGVETQRSAVCVSLLSVPVEDGGGGERAAEKKQKKQQQNTCIVFRPLFSRLYFVSLKRSIFLRSVCLVCVCVCVCACVGPYSPTWPQKASCHSAEDVFFVLPLLLRLSFLHLLLFLALLPKDRAAALHLPPFHAQSRLPARAAALVAPLSRTSAAAHCRRCLSQQQHCRGPFLTHTLSPFFRGTAGGLAAAAAQQQDYLHRVGHAAPGCGQGAPLCAGVDCGAAHADGVAARVLYTVAGFSCFSPAPRQLMASNNISACPVIDVEKKDDPSWRER